MKKIILLFILFLTVNCFAFYLYMSDEQQVKKTSVKSAGTIEAYLKDVTLEDGEYIVISAKNSPYEKLYDIQIDWLNMSYEKAGLIIEKLKSIPSISGLKPGDITMYITKRPEYDKNKNILVSCYTVNEKTNALKKAMQGYSMYFRTKLYMVWKQSKTYKPVLIYTEIDRDGNVVTFDVIKSAGEEIDKKMQAVLKQSASSIKPLEIKSDTLPMMFSFGNSDRFLERLVRNIDVSADKDFYAVVKIELDEKGNLTSSEIQKSSDDEIIDGELLDIVNKMGNFSEIINFEENKKTNYIQITGLKNHKYFVSVSDENTNQINWIPYLQEVETNAKKNWVLPKNPEFYIVRVFLLLDQTGQIKDKKIIQSSGNKNIDASVTKSVEAGIYPKFPEGFQGELMPVETNFVHYPQNPQSNMNKWQNNPWLHFYN